MDIFSSLLHPHFHARLSSRDPEELDAQARQDLGADFHRFMQSVVPSHTRPPYLGEGERRTIFKLPDSPSRPVGWLKQRLASCFGRRIEAVNILYPGVDNNAILSIALSEASVALNGCQWSLENPPDSCTGPLLRLGIDIGSIYIYRHSPAKTGVEVSN